MVKSKSDQLSIQHKDRGNQFFMQQEFYNAICEYNKALLYAKSKENLALAYANRSACFLELHKYDECLQNIQWARENNYPAENIHKLNEREERCKKLKAEQVKNPLVDIRDFFKLSHPPNPKVPFIADCLRLGTKLKNCRRGIFTTRDLKPGDVVAIEKAVFSCANEYAAHICCCNCSKAQMLNLIPCTKSASLMFCSEACRDKVHAHVKNLDSMVSDTKDSGFHPEKILRETEEAFGGRDNLLDFIKRSNWKNLNCTVFDFDFSNSDDPNYKANLIKCILSLGIKNLAPGFKEFRIKMHQELVKKAAGNNRMLEEFLMYLIFASETHSSAKAVCSNRGEGPQSMAMSNEVITEVNAFCSHINNRCRPNTIRMSAEDGCLLYIIRPIKAGEELVRNIHSKYDGTPQGIQKLTAKLLNEQCECIECQSGRIASPLESVEYDEFLMNLAYLQTNALYDLTPKPKKSHAALVERVKANWSLLASYFAKFPRPSNAHPLFNKNADVVNLLNELTFMPCLRAKSAYNP